MPNRHSDSEEPGSTVVRSSIVGVFSIAFINNSRLDEGERWRRGCVGIRSSGEGVGLNGGKFEGVSAMRGRTKGSVIWGGGSVLFRIASGFRIVSGFRIAT